MTTNEETPQADIHDATHYTQAKPDQVSAAFDALLTLHRTASETLRPYRSHQIVVALQNHPWLRDRIPQDVREVCTADESKRYPLTRENMHGAAVIESIEHPEWGTKQFRVDESGHGHHSAGSGANSFVLFESDFHRYVVVAWKR